MMILCCFSSISGVLPHSVCDVRVVLLVHDIPQPGRPSEEIHSVFTTVGSLHKCNQWAGRETRPSEYRTHITCPLQATQRRLVILFFFTTMTVIPSYASFIHGGYTWLRLSSLTHSNLISLRLLQSSLPFSNNFPISFLQIHFILLQFSHSVIILFDAKSIRA